MSSVSLNSFKLENNIIKNNSTIKEFQNGTGLLMTVIHAFGSIYDERYKDEFWKVRYIDSTFWKLHTLKDIEPLDRLAFMLMFDGYYFKAKDLKIVVSALRNINIKYFRSNEYHEDRINHLPNLIKELKNVDIDSNECLYFHYSHSDDLFLGEYIDESDSYEPLSLNDDFTDVIDYWKWIEKGNFK